MPEMGLKDKVAIVTGAGSRAPGIGNGRAAAILLAREGCKVALLDATKELGDATKEMIDAEGGTSMVVVGNVADQTSCAAAVKSVVDAWGRVDVLVNNVGIGGPMGNAVDTNAEAWDMAMRINVTSMMLMAKYAIPEMRKQGGGSIINISSIDGLKGGNPSLFYSASKGAVVNMTRSMAAHHGPEGIRVNCIAPGYVYTPMVFSGGMTPELRDARRKNTLLQTEGTGWDIGSGVVYLASEQARWVSGIILSIDAGSMAGTVGNTTPVKAFD
ncbi:SDR family oxidoreductase [Hyphomicrobium sp. CS1BSMeth3]|uniref:SDR family NAD(P)-dependent oxidoreductase n=1 Tax=Hyphomicrobium sp. CS1BSMeth3 TaxID=1892844 RepID=UPI000931A189|nr:SDR family oxidoreductase [Hyphomicrobium sp. CS1BSMeth3]